MSEATLRLIIVSAGVAAAAGIWHATKSWRDRFEERSRFPWLVDGIVVWVGIMVALVIVGFIGSWVGFWY